MKVHFFHPDIFGHSRTFHVVSRLDSLVVCRSWFVVRTWLFPPLFETHGASSVGVHWSLDSFCSRSQASKNCLLVACIMSRTWGRKVRSLLAALYSRSLWKGE